MVFGIASSFNFTAPPTHSSPFHSETEKQDRNYLLDLILFVWKQTYSEETPVKIIQSCLPQLLLPELWVLPAACIATPEIPSQMFQKEKEAPQNVEVRKSTPHRSTCMTGSDGLKL